MESAASCCSCCCCAAPGGCWATASSSEAIVDSLSASTVCLLSWCRPPVSGVGGSWRSSFTAPLEGGCGLVGVRGAGGLRLDWLEVDFERSIFVVFVEGALAGSAGCDDDVRHGNSDGGDSPPDKSRCFHQSSSDPPWDGLSERRGSFHRLDRCSVTTARRQSFIPFASPSDHRGG